jgi:hypothetical protein
MTRGVKRWVGTMPLSAGCMSIGPGCVPADPRSVEQSVMTQIEDSRQAPWQTAPIRGDRHPPRLLRSLTWRETAFAGALAAVAGGLAIAFRRGPVARQPRALPSFAPADRTLAAASPAVLGATPQRRLYAGRDLARAGTIEDLRAMAHRRLPRFALEYLEGGAEDEATRPQYRGLGGMALHAARARRCRPARSLDRIVRPQHGDAARHRADRAQ